MQIGRFKVLAFLGHGGMAQIFRCQLSGIGGFDKTLLVKRIRPELLGKPEFVSMFLDEARLAARLSHPNIVQVYEVGEDNGVPYLAMELVRGPNLSQLVRKARKAERMNLPAALKVLADVCLGLEHAHEAKSDDGSPLGIVHRDVSPQNIAVSIDGMAKLLDFGVAKAEGRLSETRAGTLKGKLGFMAPEQLVGETIDRRADVFAIGVCLYSLVTGAMPFKGKDDIEVMRVRLTGEYPPASSLAPDLAPALEKIIQKAMAVSPDERYPSALALHEDLERYLATLDPMPTTKSVARWVSALFPNPDELFTGQPVPTPIHEPSFPSNPQGLNPWERSNLGGAPSPPGMTPSHTSMPLELAPTMLTPTGQQMPEGQQTPISHPHAYTPSHPSLVAPQSGAFLAPGQTSPTGQMLGPAAASGPSFEVTVAPPRRGLAIVGGIVAAVLLAGGGGALWLSASADDEVASAETPPAELAQHLLAEAAKLLAEGEATTALDLVTRAKTTPGLDTAASLAVAREATALEVKSYLVLAEAAAARGDLEGASDKAKSVLEREPDHAEALRILEQARAARVPATVVEEEPAEEEPEAESTRRPSPSRSRSSSRRTSARKASAPRVAKLSVETAPRAQVFVDDRPLGQAPLDAIELPAGAHVVEARVPNHAPEVRRVTLAPGEELRLSLALRPEAPPAPEPVATKEPAREEPPAPKEVAKEAPKAPAPPAAEKPAPVKTAQAAPKPALPKQAPRTSLPARYKLRTVRDITSSFGKVEAELVRAGLPSSKVRGVTVLLARELATGFSPSSGGAYVYPRGMYAFAYEKLVGGASKQAVAQALAKAHKTHLLDGYRGGG